MAVQIQGNSGVVGEVETNTRAQRVTLRSADFGALGVYAISVGSSTSISSAGASGSDLVHFRWGSSAAVALVRSVIVTVASTAFGATTDLQIDMTIGRTFTAASSIGTAATLTGNNAKLRTSMGTTLLSDLRYASTGGVLAGGTVTADTQPMASLVGFCPTAPSQPILPGLYLFNTETESEYPLVLAQNEGFLIRATFSPATTGSWRYNMWVKWMEITSF